MLKAVLFDLDQTLIDWDCVVEPWDTYVLRQLKTVFDYVHEAVHAITEVGLNEMYAAYVTTLTEAWKHGVQTLRPPHIQTVMADTLVACGVPAHRLDMDAVMQVYIQHWQLPTGERAYPDVVKVLPQIRTHDVELGIITNASHPMAFRDRELAEIGLLDHFPRCRVSAADVGFLKPHRSIFDHALAILDIRPDEAVFVGDNLEADVGGAQGVGMRGVWRAHPLEQDQAQVELDITPDGEIATLHDLLPLLDEWYPGWRNGHMS